MAGLAGVAGRCDTAAFRASRLPALAAVSSLPVSATSLSLVFLELGRARSRSPAWPCRPRCPGEAPPTAACDIVATTSALATTAACVVGNAAVGHRGDAAEMLALHEHRALAVLDGVLRLGELRGGRQRQRGAGRGQGEAGESIHRGVLLRGGALSGAVDQCRERRANAHSNNPQHSGPATLLICAFRIRFAYPMSASFEPIHPPRRAGSSSSRAPARIWDLPTRLFHWALAAGGARACWSTGLGGAMEWHFRFGYAVLALLLFRLVWGFVGGRWSRFASFLYSPRWRSGLPARPRPPGPPGRPHARSARCRCSRCWACWWLQVGTGLLSDDEISASGPLTRFVSNATVEPGDPLAHAVRQVDRDRAGQRCTCWRCCSTCWCKRQRLVRPDDLGRQAAGRPARRREPRRHAARGWRRCACSPLCAPSPPGLRRCAHEPFRSPARCRSPTRPTIVLLTPDEPHELDAARAIFRDYAASLSVDLSFQNFEDELASLPGDYAEPRGALLLALVDVGGRRCPASCAPLLTRGDGTLRPRGRLLRAASAGHGRLRRMPPR